MFMFNLVPPLFLCFNNKKVAHSLFSRSIMCVWMCLWVVTIASPPLLMCMNVLINNSNALSIVKALPPPPFTCVWTWFSIVVSSFNICVFPRFSLCVWMCQMNNNSAFFNNNNEKLRANNCKANCKLQGLCYTTTIARSSVLSIITTFLPPPLMLCECDFQ